MYVPYFLFKRFALRIFSFTRPCSFALVFILNIIFFNSEVFAQKVVTKIVVHSAPLAGFQYHAAQSLWSELHVGDRLDLIREPENPYDNNAIRVEWNGEKLGYIPKKENAKLAEQMDLGIDLNARISKLNAYAKPKYRLEFEVEAPLEKEDK